MSVLLDSNNFLLLAHV